MEQQARQQTLKAAPLMRSQRSFRSRPSRATLRPKTPWRSGNRDDGLPTCCLHPRRVSDLIFQRIVDRCDASLTRPSARRGIGLLGVRDGRPRGRRSPALRRGWSRRTPGRRRQALASRCPEGCARTRAGCVHSVLMAVPFASSTHAGKPDS